MFWIFNERKNEILGLNRRNQKYIRPYNSKRSKRYADSKLLTKSLLSKFGIKTPELYFVIRSRKQLQNFDWNLLPKSFVLKPNQGTGGKGIIVFVGKKKGKYEWIRPNGLTMTQKEIQIHIENIIDGRFSMGNIRDIALIEERLKNDLLLKQYSYKGVPDIRVIVFNKVPVMAELRLPTKESDGTANLHAGGIGVGIDIASGVTTTAIHRKKTAFVSDSYEIVENTLDLEENLSLRGIKIPFWDEILEISVKCQIESGLGYAGIDIALDREKGPMVFELNARPGLAIQIANLAGLRARLERVQGLEVKSVKQGIRIAKDLFGGEVEEEIEELSGKQIVNLVERVTIFHKPLTQIKLKKHKVKIKQKYSVVKAYLDTGITTSRIDDGLVVQIGLSSVLAFVKTKDIPKRFESFVEAQNYINTNLNQLQHEDIVRWAKIVEDGKIKIKPVISIKIKIRGYEMEFEAIISTQTEMLYPILIGRKELKDFLIDPSKTFVRQIV